MNKNETIIDAEETDTRPRKTRQPKSGRRIYVYRLMDGKPKEQGNFPEAVIGDPLERRLPTFLQEVFGPGDYKTEIRKTNGHFEQSFEFSIGEKENESERIIDVDPDDDFEESTGGFDVLNGNNSQMNAMEVENLLLKERLKRIEEDVSRQKTGNQSEMQTLISALEESRREQRELMMMMINQSQRPQQDATTQAMSILEKSLGIVTKAKAISEEIAPQEQPSNGSFMGDAARLIDSLGKNAGTFVPLISRVVGSSAAAAPQRRPMSPTDAEGSNGDLTNLAEKIKQNKNGKSTIEGAKTK